MAKSNKKNNAVNFLLNLNTCSNRKCGPSKQAEILAEKSFLRRIYTGQRSVRKCEIPESRAKFLTVFSPDGTKLACTNGNHNAYILDVRTQKVLKILSGHKRTPWTISFHPTINNIVASGCLNGEVRIWNLDDDSFESWCSPSNSAIASIAFHPIVKLLVIATSNHLYFWNWSTAIMYAEISTTSDEEKVRFVKFDSSGNKLITAIAHKRNHLSHFDATNFREVFEFTQQRSMLKDFLLIEKFFENEAIELKDFQNNTVYRYEVSESNSDHIKKPSMTSMLMQNLPYMCSNHYQTFQDFSNVDCFCPGEFAENVMMNVLKTKFQDMRYFCDKCYFCRYTWLCTAIFEFKLYSCFSNHVNIEIPMNHEIPPWKFSESRKRKLEAENEDECDGIISEFMKQSFAQYAQEYIAPLFADRIPNGVCSKCFSIKNFPSYSPFEGFINESLPNPHISLDPDNFIDLFCHFGFEPSGGFIPFLKAFSDVRRFIPNVKLLSTDEDYQKFDGIMSEWEYFYCKLLLINNIIEGDSEFILRKMPFNSVKSESTQSRFTTSIQRRKCRFKSREYLAANRNLSNEERDGKPPNETPDLKKLVENVVKTVECTQNERINKTYNCKCRQLEMSDENSMKKSIQMLKRDIENFSNVISNWYDPRVQRSRLEKLYNHALDAQINDRGISFRTLQICRKSVIECLIVLISELKKLLRQYFKTSSSNDSSQFRIIFFRTFVFLVRRVMSLCTELLDVIRNFNYDINKLTSNNRLDSIRQFDSSYVSMYGSLPPSIFPHRRNDIFALASASEPIFDEEFESYPSEWSDEELNSDIDDSLSNVERDVSGSSKRLSPVTLRRRLDILSEKEVIASNTYLSKHVQVLEINEQNWSTNNRQSYNHFERLYTEERQFLQNVDRLYQYFRYQNEEDVQGTRFHPLHRVQAWDFSKLEIPNITLNKQNVVVTECKIHNDATISISSDDSLIAVLIAPNQFEQPDWIAIFSFQWKTFGHILCAISLKQLTISLSFSPTSQHLAVGYSYLYKKNIKMADVIDVKREIRTWRQHIRKRRPSPIVTSLIDVPPLHRFNSGSTINCIRWIPTPGHGFVFGNSGGEIKFVS